MNSRARLTLSALFSLLAATHGAGSAYAGTNLPTLKVDPRLLGLPALEAEAPLPHDPQAATPSAAPLAAKPLVEPVAAKPIPLPPPVAVEKAASEPAKAPIKASVAPKPATPAPVIAAEKPAAAKLAPPRPPEPRFEPKPVIAPPMPESVAAISPEPPIIAARQPDANPLTLQSTLALPKRDEQSGEDTPTFISGMRLQGKHAEYVEAEDDAELRKLDVVVTADRLRYDEQKETLDAKGNVRLQTSSGVMKGPDLHFKIADETGYMNTPEYAIAAESAHGRAQKLTFLGQQK